MGIYIKGMEVPFTCLSCEFHKCSGGTGDYCTLTKKKQFRFKNRPSWCPLVPVPEHGRLIDADALAAQCDDPYWCVWLSDIENAPTIIPAEPPKEELA